MTNRLVYTFKPYFVILRENLAGIFSKIKSRLFIIIVYKVCVQFYFVYFLLEGTLLKVKLKKLMIFRICITKFFITKLKKLLFSFYYYYFYFMIKLK